MISRAVKGVMFFGGLVVLGVLAFVASNSPDAVVKKGGSFQLESPCKGSADCIGGIVTKVVDGDTLDINNTRIRLSLVNTPEVNQAGYEAKQFTSQVCPVGSKALADEDDGQTQGSYGRVIAKVTCAEGKVLNEELLKASMAEILVDFCNKSEFRDEGWAKAHGC